VEGRHRLTVALAAAVTLAAAAPAGAEPIVQSTTALGADPVREAAWAGFFRALPHGAELATVTVILGTEADVTARCGSEADGCYLPAARTIVMPGGALPGGGVADEIARHEYGHHIAEQADNAPFSRGLGTKRWFTDEDVCRRLRSGALVDDAAQSYSRSVAEGFAEAYRVASGGQEHLWIVDSSLFPDAGARQAILTDVAHPWTGPRVRVLQGRVRGDGAVVPFRVPLDGDITVSGRRRLELLDRSGRRLAHGRTVHFTDCGRRRLWVRVAGRPGPFRLTVQVP
jgi:hypothetical protein